MPRRWVTILSPLYCDRWEAKLTANSHTPQTFQSPSNETERVSSKAKLDLIQIQVHFVYDDVFSVEKAGVSKNVLQ